MTTRRNTVSGWLFAGPYTILFLAFLIFPIFYGIYLSLTNASLSGRNNTWAGFSNYTAAFADPMLWQAFGNTLWFTVLTAIPLVALSFVLAFLVYSGMAGQWLWRLSLFAPYLLPVTAVTGLWGWMMQPQYGLFNGVLAWFGIEGPTWLSDEKWAMVSIVWVTVWWTIGFNFLLYLSALQGIPEQLFEAAAIDGAGAWRRLWSITLPQMRPTTMLIVLLQLLASLKLFEQSYFLTGGGPAFATRSVVQYIYEQGFTGYRLGYAGAMSYIFFALVLVVSLAQLALTRKQAR
ncbi:sugar ABC transporter permease [Micrococcales bacterium 31B]|nr:sugar ABC transporter permease [Micrococcales bacterium 31B]